MSIKEQCQKLEPKEVANPDEIILLPSLECPIDQMIPLDGELCSKCQTIFCKDCIKEWRRTKDSCPMRCKPFILLETKKSIIESEIKKIKVKCCCEGCPEIILLLEREKHLSTCKYNPVPCEYCGRRIKPVMMDYHLRNECGCIKNTCPHCHNFCSFDNFLDHVKSCEKKNIGLEITKCKICNLLDIKDDIESSGRHKCMRSKNEADIWGYYSALMHKCRVTLEDSVKQRVIATEESKKILLENQVIIESDIRAMLNYVDSKTEAHEAAVNEKISGYKAELLRRIELLKNNNNTMRAALEQKSKEIEFINSKLNSRKENIQEEIDLKKEHESQTKDLEEKILNNLLMIEGALKEKEEEKKPVEEEENKEEEKGEESYEPGAVECSNCVDIPEEIFQCNNKGAHSKKNNSFCQNCSIACSLCGERSCKECSKKCFSAECGNEFCHECYEKNKHLIHGPESSCKIFICENCKKYDSCVMQSEFVDGDRICHNCMIKKGKRK